MITVALSLTVRFGWDGTPCNILCKCFFLTNLLRVIRFEIRTIFNKKNFLRYDMNMLFSLFYHGIQKLDSKTDELSETTAILDRVEHLFIRILSSELNTREPEKT